MRVGERGILVTTAEAARFFRRPASTIRRWASEDGWPPFGSGYRRYWPIERVERSAELRGLDNDQPVSDSLVNVGVVGR